MDGKDTISIEIIGNEDIVTTETETLIGDDAENEEKYEKNFERMNLRLAAIKGKWSRAESILKEHKELATIALDGDGSTVLHIAVGIGHNDFVRNLFAYIDEEQVLGKRSSDGSTALHIAAIVGNRTAVELLVKKNNKLLNIKDHKGKEALQKAYENMHLDTIGYLLKPVNDDTISLTLSLPSKESVHTHLNPGVEIGVDLLVQAISAKQYNLAMELLKMFPKFASKNDDVLMALAKTFPSGLDYGETLLYLSIDIDWVLISGLVLVTILFPSYPVVVVIAIIVFIHHSILRKRDWEEEDRDNVLGFIYIPPIAVIVFFLMMGYFIFFIIYFLLWKGAKILAFGPIEHIENKKKEWDEAKEILEFVCDEIAKLEFSGSYHPFYKRPILEAASQNAYKVVDEILFRSPEAIGSKSKSGYDIIQLAVIHRSEKIYNLIYDIGERKNLYRTIEDSSKNNILHLAGKLAPSRELDQRAGAALQLQRELQWREEVKKLVFPTYITRENIFKETPDMVFKREHENLVREGEKWMKTTAESCSITAALITTMVFAAAITVPGGTHQETGIPMFKNNTAFTVFAVSDAISLFASSTALLVFLSILTARFSEKDFLVSLPRRLFIGLFSLLLSTTAMMIAFGATLFLVFCDKKRWTLAPICGLAFIPIAFFVTLQFPLMVDLFRSTILRMFGKEGESVLRRYNPDDIRLFFGK